jgi:hypothetical protein
MNKGLMLLYVCGFFLVALFVIVMLSGCSDQVDDPIIGGDTINLAPGIPPNEKTTVFAVWGASTYHKDTYRFIIKTKKPACVFELTAGQAEDMGLHCCSSCFKAPKEPK